MTDDSSPLDPSEESADESRDLEGFFQRLPSNFRWPKPNEEAVATAIEAIQRMSGGGDVAQELAKAGLAEPTAFCSGCQNPLSPGLRFCGYCGLSTEVGAADTVPQASVSPAQHHVHHHYHHILSNRQPSAVPATEPGNAVPLGRAPGSPGHSPGGRAELMARQVLQDWAQACNTRHIDDLVELYATDATLIRSSVPPVRSLPAIREFLLSMLEAGLGDVEIESLRLEVMGEVAIDMGRCKMLVPVAMGKRREERGKYLVVLARQPVGTWKIVADCWSLDLPVTAPPPAEAHARKAVEPPAQVRKPR